MPDNPRACVLTWASSGGLRASETQGPDLIVTADGGVTVGERFGGTRGVERTLSPERLQNLLSVAIDDAGFFDIDSGQIEAQLRAARRGRFESATNLSVPLGPPYVDAGTTRIMVAADGRYHEVAVQGLSAAARDYPEIEALSRLRSLELRLLRLAESLRVAQAP